MAGGWASKVYVKWTSTQKNNHFLHLFSVFLLEYETEWKWKLHRNVFIVLLVDFLILFRFSEGGRNFGWLVVWGFCEKCSHWQGLPFFTESPLIATFKNWCSSQSEWDSLLESNLPSFINWSFSSNQLLSVWFLGIF